MRVFVAVDIDDGIRKAIAELQEQLKSELKLDKKAVKWVRPGAMHLTLKFLGEVKDKAITEVCDIVKQVAEKHKAFDLSIENVGSFGGKSARVLWVGTGAGSKQLERLVGELDERLGDIGFAREKKAFTGHLTLCRIKDYKAGIKLVKKANSIVDFVAGVTNVDSVKVYESKLTSAGPVYTVLAESKMVH